MREVTGGQYYTSPTVTPGSPRGRQGSTRGKATSCSSPIPHRSSSPASARRRSSSSSQLDSSALTGKDGRPYKNNPHAALLLEVQTRLLRTSGSSFSYVSGRSQSGDNALPWIGVGRDEADCECHEIPTHDPSLHANSNERCSLLTGRTAPLAVNADKEDFANSFAHTRGLARSPSPRPTSFLHPSSRSSSAPPIRPAVLSPASLARSPRSPRTPSPLPSGGTSLPHGMTPPPPLSFTSSRPVSPRPGSRPGSSPSGYSGSPSPRPNWSGPGSDSPRRERVARQQPRAWRMSAEDDEMQTPGGGAESGESNMVSPVERFDIDRLG